MTWLATFFLGIAILAAIGAAVLLSRRSRPGPPVSFVSKGALLTEAEQRFAHALDLAAKGRYRIAPKVGLADVIVPHRATRESRQSGIHERIRGVVLDFLLCDVLSYDVLAAIRLIDAQGLADETEEARFVEDALRSANIHSMRIVRRSTYSAADLAAEIEAVLQHDFVDTLTLAHDADGGRVLGLGTSRFR
jgi:hypothetical protein